MKNQRITPIEQAFNLVTENLAAASTAQLRALNDFLVAELRRRQRRDIAEARDRFKVGDVATFKSNKLRRWVTVRVAELLSKNARCVELNPDGSPTGVTWRVTPTLLQKVPPVKGVSK